jgi:ABC-2 type transport system permease protein
MTKKNLLQNIDLVRVLVSTDFKLKYNGSFFGYLWSLVKPFSYFGVLYIVFTKIFNVGSDIPYYPVYLLLGITIFSFWGESTSVAMGSIVSRGDLLRKVYFPRILLIISSTLTSFITFSLNLLVVFLFAIIMGVDFNLSAIKIILLIFQLYLFVLGVSFYLSALYVKFRDIGHIWEVTNQILFYATPIVYPLFMVPERFAKFMVLSPLTQIIQDARIALIGYDAHSTSSYWQFSGIPLIIVFLIFISGYHIFNVSAAKFAEEI